MVSEGAPQIHLQSGARADRARVAVETVPRPLAASGGAAASTTKPAQSAGADTDTGENARCTVHVAAPTSSSSHASCRPPPDWMGDEELKAWLRQARADLNAGRSQGGDECHRRYWLQQASEKGIKALGLCLTATPWSIAVVHHQ